MKTIENPNCRSGQRWLVQRQLPSVGALVEIRNDNAKLLKTGRTIGCLPKFLRVYYWANTIGLWTRRLWGWRENCSNTALIRP